MHTATVNRNSGESVMIHLKLAGYFCNINILKALFLLDITGGLFSFFTKYIFEDITYLKFLIVACIVDLVTGITKAIVTQGIKSVTSKGLRDTVLKIVTYGSFLIIIHVLTHFQIGGIVSTAFTWLNKVALEFLILIEVKSVYENIIRINPKLDFIDSVLQKIVNYFKDKKNA